MYLASHSKCNSATNQSWLKSKAYNKSRTREYKQLTKKSGKHTPVTAHKTRHQVCFFPRIVFFHSRVPSDSTITSSKHRKCFSFLKRKVKLAILKRENQVAQISAAYIVCLISGDVAALTRCSLIC